MKRLIFQKSSREKSTIFKILAVREIKNSNLVKSVGICGRNHFHGRNHRRFHPSCICLVYFLRNSTEFHVMQAECQRIIFHILLIIVHKLLAISC